MYYALLTPGVAQDLYSIDGQATTGISHSIKFRYNMSFIILCCLFRNKTLFFICKIYHDHFMSRRKEYIPLIVLGYFSGIAHQQCDALTKCYFLWKGLTPLE